MDRTLARYPFLDAAREAVQRAGPSFEALVGGEGGSAALRRAVGRVEAALGGETVGEAHRDPEVEVLSYPLARILVSLVDDERVTRRYVRAEARTARDRARRAGSGGPDGATADRDRLLEEFDLAVDAGEAGLEVDAIRYLSLATSLEGDRWRLVNRPVRDCVVAVAEEEVYDLIEAAVRDRVGEDLPLEVPGELEGALGDAVDGLEDHLGRPSLPADFDHVDPELFPPCMRALIDRVEAGDRLPPRSRYALAAFLTSVGVAPEDLGVVIEGPIPADLETMAGAVAGTEGPTQFPPGSCETLVVYDVCTEPDDLCDRIDNPLEYYARRLAGEAATR